MTSLFLFLFVVAVWNMAFVLRWLKDIWPFRPSDHRFDDVSFFRDSDESLKRRHDGSSAGRPGAGECTPWRRLVD